MLQKPINKALDFVIKGGLKLAGPIIRGIKGISSRVKSKVAAGKAWVRGKVDGRQGVGEGQGGGRQGVGQGQDAGRTESAGNRVPCR